MTTYTWNNSGLGGFASEETNWTPVGVPTIGDDVVIGDGPNCSWDIIDQLNSFTLNGNCAVTLEAALTSTAVSLDGSNLGTLDATANPLTFLETFYEAGNCLGLTNPNIFSSGSGSGTFENSSICALVLNKSGGTITIANCVLSGLNVDASSAWTLQLSQLGSHSVSGSIALDGTASAQLVFQSDSDGNAATISHTSLSDSETYTTFKDITISGPELQADVTCIDNGNNTNISFANAGITNAFVDFDINELEQKLFEKAFNESTLTDIIPSARIRSQLPQDAPLPYLRGLFSNDVEWGTKSKLGLNSTWEWHIWSDYAGNKEVNQIAMMLIKIYHQNPVVLENGGQNVVLQFSGKLTSIEPDGVTHHSVVSFKLLTM